MAIMVCDKCGCSINNAGAPTFEDAECPGCMGPLRLATKEEETEVYNHLDFMHHTAISC
jgi:uncharacterized paraquat-inducible protein A